MRSLTAITLLAVVAQAYAKELTANRISDSQGFIDKIANKLIAKLSNKLLCRALQVPPLHHADLDDATLGKLGHSAVTLYTSLRALPAPGTHAHSALGDSTSPRAGYRPQFRLKATSAPLPWAGYQPQFHGEATLGRRIQASAFVHHEIGQLASLAIQPGDLMASLTMLSDLPRELLSWYNNEVLAFPLMTKATTSGVCYSVGDLCAQGIAGKNLSTVDLSRSARSGVAGFIGHGPVKHYELDFLNTVMSFGGAWWAVVPKLVIEEGPMAFVMNTLYSLLTGAFAFRDPREVFRDVKATFLPGFKANIKFWPVVDLINFSVIPVELQVLYSGTANIFWVCILSHLNNDAIGHNGVDDGSKKTVIVIQGEQ